MSAAAFSQDGSLLAVAAGDTVTLWDPSSNALIACLGSPSANQGSPLSKLCFVSNSPYLVGYTTGANPSLIAWNLLTESVWWSYQLAVSALAADPSAGSVAVAVLPRGSKKDLQEAQQAQRSKPAEQETNGEEQETNGEGASKAKVSKTTDKILKQGAVTMAGTHAQQPLAGSAVMVFSVATGQPQLTWSLGQAAVAALLFALPGTKLHASSLAATPDGVSPLLVVLQHRQYIMATSLAHVKAASVQTSTPEQGREPGAFEAAFGKAVAKQPAQQSAGPSSVHADVQGRLQRLFDAPSHVLPSLTDLAPMFFDSFINKSRAAT